MKSSSTCHAVTPIASPMAGRIVRTARTDLYGHILSSWNDDDRERLADLMGRLIEALEAHRRWRLPDGRIET